MERFLTILGELFLAEAEKPEYQQLTAEDAKLEWLNEHIQDRIQPPARAVSSGCVSRTCKIKISLHQSTLEPQSQLRSYSLVLQQTVCPVRRRSILEE